LQYVKDMDAWFKANRTDQLFCADVIDVHHYCIAIPRDLFNPDNHGISPEEDNLIGRLQPWVDYKQQHHPNKEFWLSEFGYDTGINSPQRSSAYGNFTAEEVQSMWLVRSYMEIIASGFDRGFLFNIYDESDNQDLLYQTSGIMRSEANGYTKKHAWDVIANLSAKLNGLIFRGDQSSNPNKRIYLFTNVDNSKRAAVIWSPTSDGTVIPGFQYEGETIEVSEMPIILELSADTSGGGNTGGGTGGGTAGSGAKKVVISIDDANEWHSVKHDFTLAAADKMLLNGEAVIGDILIEVRRASVVQSSPRIANTVAPYLIEKPVEKIKA